MEELEKPYVIISSFDDVSRYINKLLQGQIINVMFKRTSLKVYCFSKIQENIDTNIINCESCMQRFCEQLIIPAKLVIFDNIGRCKDQNIIDIVKNKKGILVY